MLYRIFAAVLAGLLCHAPLRADTVKLEIVPSAPVLLAGEAHTAYLKISLGGLKPERRSQRAPVNIALVLDRSGSMSGQKIAQARKAAISVLDYLNSDDILAVIAYDTTVDVLVPATKVSDKGLLADAIRRLEARDSTALYAGVSKGGDEVRKFLEKNRVNRIILLSDGLANVGPASPDELGKLGAQLARDGVSVTTLGLGLDYNEDLMRQLAGRSDGNHAFIENASDLARIFSKEFGDVLSVVAQGVEIEIECGPGVRPKRLLGRDGEIGGQRVHARLNQLYGNQEKYLLLEVEVSPGQADQQQELATVRVRYTDLDNRQQQVSGAAGVHFTASPEAVRENRDVMAAAAEQIAVQNSEEAVRLRDAGQVREAQKLLQDNAAYLQEKAEQYAAPRLAEQGESNARAADNLDSGSWERERKQMRKDQHTIETQQSY